jgi:hypothetical protein
MGLFCGLRVTFAGMWGGVFGPEVTSMKREDGARREGGAKEREGGEGRVAAELRTPNPQPRTPKKVYTSRIFDGVFVGICLVRLFFGIP